jgi:hypothetical protein
MKRKLSRKIVTSVLVLANLSVVLLASGCAAKACKMVPKDFEVINKHPYTVSVNESTGGKDAKPLWHSQVSNSAFTEALSNALAKSGVFQAVIKGGGVDYSGGADYILDVTILGYDQPCQGANIDIRMKTKWELTDAKTLAPVWSNTFKTAYRAVWLKSLFDGERIEKAHEGAVRTNIKEGIRRLSLLSLKLAGK